MEFIINCPVDGPGIYKIKNNKDFRVYIGRTKHLKQRAEEHKKNFQAGRGNRKIKKFIKENPDAVYTFDVLAMVQDIERAEEVFIKRFDAVRFGFNLVYNDYEIKLKFINGRRKKKAKEPKEKALIKGKREKKEQKPRKEKEPCISLSWLKKTKAYRAINKELNQVQIK